MGLPEGWWPASRGSPPCASAVDYPFPGRRAAHSGDRESDHQVSRATRCREEACREEALPPPRGVEALRRRGRRLT